MKTRVIGLGQRHGGDDAVGRAVIARLRALAPPAAMELVEVDDPSALIEALLSERRVVLVDALLGAGDPGRVHHLAPEQLGQGALAALSTHGLDVPQAIALARSLYPDAVSPRIELVGIEIARATRFTEGLSPPVLAAVDEAAKAVMALASEASPSG